MKRRVARLQRGLTAGHAHLERGRYHAHLKVCEHSGAEERPGHVPSRVEDRMMNLGVVRDALY